MAKDRDLMRGRARGDPPRLKQPGDDEDRRRQPERTQHEAGTRNPSGGGRGGSALTETRLCGGRSIPTGPRGGRRDRFAGLLPEGRWRHLLPAIVDEQRLNLHRLTASRSARSGPDGGLGRRPAGRTLLPGYEAFQSELVAVAHRAKAEAVEPVNRRCRRRIAAPAQQVGGQPPRRPGAGFLDVHKLHVERRFCPRSSYDAE